MLELIFQGFVEWGYGLTLECWEYFSSALLDIMSMDFAYLRSHIPVITPIMQSMLAVGWALLLGNLVFQAAKTMMSGLGFEGEDPKLLFTRTFVFAFLLLASPQICQLCLNMTSTVIDIMEVPDAVNITLADEATFDGLAAAWILVVICGIIVMFQSFKLIFQMAERYFILAVLTICAPMAFGTGGSRNTSDIFNGWCRMYGSMCLMMVLNVVFIKMLLSVLSYCPSGLDVLPWMVLVLTIVKVAKKADSIVSRIGLNPALTGDSLGRSFPGMLTYMVARTAVSHVANAIGKNGGGGRAKGPNTPPGGSSGPKPGAPPGGRTASTHSSAASNVSLQQNSGQTASQQNTSQQSNIQQGAVQQTGTQQNKTYSNTQQGGSTVQTAGTNSSGVQNKQSSMPSEQMARKTSVPPGTRRAPTHVKSTLSADRMNATADKGRTVGTAGTAPRYDEHSAPGSMQTDMAGKVSALNNARYTNVTSQNARQGAVTSNVQAKEQNNISVSTPQNNTGDQVFSNTANGPVGQISNQTTRTAQQESHHSRKPSAEGRVATAQPRAVSATKVATTQPIGTVGKDNSIPMRRSSVDSRHSRNDVSKPTAAFAAKQQSDTARQEQHRSGQASTPHVTGQTSGVRPGTAGSAASAERVSQGRQSARNQAVQTPSAPLATNSRGARRADSTTIGSEKKTASKERRSAVGRGGGIGNGR